MTSAEVDVLDRGALVALLRTADLVLNCAGPFSRLGVVALEAAIDAGTSYVDICDDPAPTRDLFELDERARAAGVGALIGMGASPGLSNLLAVRAAGRLDDVHDCYTAWPLDLPSPGQDTSPRDEGLVDDGVSAAAVHLMDQISGSIPVVEGGSIVRRVPLEAVDLSYPGLGDGTAYTVGHPEPISLGPSLGVTGRAATLMLAKRTSIPFLRRIRSDIDADRLTLDAAAEAALRPSLRRSVRALVGAASYRGHGRLPVFFALLTGTRDGEPLVVGCHATAGPQGMDGATAVPAVLAVDQILSRPMRPGVHPPEAVVDVDPLLTALLPHCVPSRASVDELAPVTEMSAPS